MQPPESDPGEVDRLFDLLIDLPPEERHAALEDARPDAAVRSQVERLLGHFEGGPSALDDVSLLPHEAGGPGGHPERIGAYTVRGVLGTGAMGIVYLAEHEERQQPVAVKVLRGSFAAKGKARFEREAALLGRLQHPGIAQIFEAGSTEGESGPATYIAMEFIDGSPITDYARAAELDTLSRVRLLIELARAVQHAHERGVLHRDLKPSNVLVTAGGQVKVIDFGVARALDAEGAMTPMTMKGQIIGTLTYMSPEQVGGEIDRVDARTDVYTLGAMAYELLSGRLPYDLRNYSIVEIALIIAEMDPPQLGTIVEACRGDLERIVGKALEKEPERRYPSAAALADDLERYADARTTSDS